MTIVNMVGGGGSEDSELSKITMKRAPSCTIYAPAGSRDSNMTYYNLTTLYNAAAYNKFGYKADGYGSMSSSSTTATKKRSANITLTPTHYLFRDWISKYGIENASGKITGYWTTYAYSSGSFKSLPVTNNTFSYNVSIVDGVVNFTNTSSVSSASCGVRDTLTNEVEATFWLLTADINTE